MKPPARVHCETFDDRMFDVEERRFSAALAGLPKVAALAAGGSNQIPEMTLVKTIPKLLGATAVLVVGPFIGVLIGLILALLTLASDPKFLRNGGRASPADGILILLYVAISLVISIPMSIFGAGLLLFGSRNDQLQEARQ